MRAIQLLSILVVRIDRSGSVGVLDSIEGCHRLDQPRRLKGAGKEGGEGEGAQISPNKPLMRPYLGPFGAPSPLPSLPPSPHEKLFECKPQNGSAGMPRCGVGGLREDSGPKGCPPKES